MATKQEMLKGSKKVLATVHPELAARVEKLIGLLADNGLFFGAFMGLRTWKEQDDLYAQGRTKPGSKVTNAKGGQSPHNFGLAVDLVEDGDPNMVGIQWSWKNNADYLKIGKYAKECGLEWGGFWTSFVDLPHVQMMCGLSTQDCRALYNKSNSVKSVWDEVDRRLKSA